MDVEVLQVDGLSMIGRATSGHWVPMDTKVENGGNNAGATPLEMVVMGLCGCTMMDMITILESMHVPFNTVKVSAKADRKEEHPTGLEKIHMVYTIVAKPGEEVPPKKVERAIRLSEEKYCAVSASLKPGVEITWEYEIVDS